MGKLQEMLDAQYKLQARLDYDINTMNTRNTTEFIKEFSIHLNQEINEMLYELPFFKPWKDYTKITAHEKLEANEKAKKEFIDALHFFLNIALALRLDENEMYAMYMDKNQENHTRQDAGYTHDVSYR